MMLALIFVELFSFLYIGIRFVQYAIKRPVMTTTKIEPLFSLPVSTKQVITSQSTNTVITKEPVQIEAEDCEIKRKTIPKGITLKDKIARVKHLIQSRNEIEINYLEKATGLSAEEIIKITKESLGFEISDGKIINKKIA
jgi:hypothetical protein